MFEFIDAASFKNAIPAGHAAIQFMRCWAAATALSGRVASFEGLSPNQAALAKRIISEIEAVEGVPSSRITPAKIDAYVEMISERLQEVSRRDLHFDREKGKNLLSKLRLVGK